MGSLFYFLEDYLRKLKCPYEKLTYNWFAFLLMFGITIQPISMYECDHL